MINKELDLMVIDKYEELASIHKEQEVLPKRLYNDERWRLTKRRDDLKYELKSLVNQLDSTNRNLQKGIKNNTKSREKTNSNMSWSEDYEKRKEKEKAIKHEEEFMKAKRIKITRNIFKLSFVLFLITQFLKPDKGGLLINGSGWVVSGFVWLIITVIIVMCFEVYLGKTLKTRLNEMFKEENTPADVVVEEIAEQEEKEIITDLKRKIEDIKERLKVAENTLMERENTNKFLDKREPELRAKEEVCLNELKSLVNKY